MFLVALVVAFFVIDYLVLVFNALRRCSYYLYISDQDLGRHEWAGLIGPVPATIAVVDDDAQGRRLCNPSANLHLLVSFIPAATSSSWPSTYLCHL